MTTEELEWSDYGRWHGAKVGLFWFLLLFPLGTADYYAGKWVLWAVRSIFE